MTEPVYDEADVVARAANGEENAFEELVSRYHGRCWRLALRMLGNSQDAQDAVQESFLSAYRALSRFRVGESFAAWIVTIVTHRCLNLLRGRRRARLCPLPQGLAASDDLQDRLDKMENEQRLQWALQQLPPGPLAIVALHYTEGLSCARIGEILGMTESAVKVSLFRARTRLREILKSSLPPTGSPVGHGGGS